MADALTERCWVCTKLCDAERGCIVAPEAYAGHDVLACSDNHFNRAYEMAMGIKPANRTFYDFARVAERRDEGRGKDGGFRIQEIIFTPNFPPYRRDELSKSLRAENLSDKDYRQLLKEIMLSTQSKGEFEWAVSEIRKLNKKGAESFEANSIPYDFNKMPAIFKSWRRNTAYCINNGNESTLCGTGDRWSSRGHGSAGLHKITCQKCKSKWNKLNNEDIERIEEAWERNGFMDSSWYDAETFEADGGIQVAEGYNEWWDELDAIRNEYPPDKFFNRRLGNPKWEDVILEQLYKDGWTPRQALYTWKFYTGQAFAFRVKPDERQMELYEYKLKPQKCGNCGGIGHNRRSCSASRNDPDFDEDKADRNKDGEISDWERAVGNAVAKGIREHKDKKGAETFEADYTFKKDCWLCSTYDGNEEFIDDFEHIIKQEHEAHDLSAKIYSIIEGKGWDSVSCEIDYFDSDGELKYDNVMDDWGAKSSIDFDNPAKLVSDISQLYLADKHHPSPSSKRGFANFPQGKIELVDMGNTIKVSFPNAFDETKMNTLYIRPVEATCRDCYGTGGLYDSRLGIDDECASCGGTGETFEAEQIQYDVMKGKLGKGHEYANYISLHDSYEEAEAVAKRERKKLEKDEAIFIVEESFDDETFELDTTLLRSISLSPMIESFPDASKDSFGAEGYKECCTKDNIRVHHRGGAIYHDDEAELTYYPAECMVCGREYEAGLPMYSSSTEIVKLDAEALVIPDGDSVPYHILKRLDKEGIRYRWIEGNYDAETFEAPIMPFNRSGRPCPSCRSWSQSFIGGVCSRCANKDRKNAESVSDLELKKDSCCCGATKKTPCVCMILGRDCSAKKPMCACYRLKAIQQKDEKGAETFEAEGDDKYYINNRPQWMPKLMKGSVEKEEEGTYSRYDKGYVAGLFLKSVKDARLNGILKQTNYQDSDVVGFIMPFDLITRKIAKDYEPLVLKDNFGKSNKYLVINGTPYNYDVFNSMLMRLPPTTEVRISGKPKNPLMFEFKFLNEHYLMFLAPYVVDAPQHEDYAKEVMSKSGAGFGFKKPSKAKELSKEEAQKAYDEGREKIRKRMFYPKGGVGLYSPAKERFEKAIDGREAKTDFNDASELNPLLEKALPLMTDAEMEDYVLISTKGNKEDKPLTTAFFEMIVEERSEGNDPDFDPEKADRDNDGEISDWERAVGNAVAKGIREHKEKKEAESRPVSYMVKSDAHKLNKASKRIHDKADKNREYPEWWKSKLSVVRNDADKLSDFLDYAVVEGVFESEGDHDHEEIDELIDKLNTVVDFAITFVHDGGYGGEPKGILVDEDLGIKTEVVHYIEGSIQLNLVRDIDTNELLSVRFSLTGDPDQTPIVYLPLPEEITTVPEDDRVSAKN